eukprot:Tbor_TRINITY_DN6164_c1_g1::TRINITY_DN6164_c1_g1_i1::g.22589::m.22589
MRYSRIIIVLVVLVILQCCLVFDVSKVKHYLSRISLQPSDKVMVDWIHACSNSPEYLADVAYTLKQITDVLEEFEISYILEGATLLGALRMNGPLPYDDDIDITVLEEDFVPK